MTIWDQIYKNYQKGGEAWASLSEDIHPLFKKFLEQSSFKRKCVLDIGCGTGTYLKFLELAGFQVDGIDSSPTAVKMAKNNLGEDSLICCSDMFGFEIPDDKYDLIISVSAIHHGTKKQIRSLINKIYKALVGGGGTFITIPDFESSKKWDTFKKYKKIDAGTFIPLLGPEKGLIHSFYTKEEVLSLFSRFKDLKLDLDDRGRWIIRAFK